MIIKALLPLLLLLSACSIQPTATKPFSPTAVEKPLPEIKENPIFSLQKPETPPTLDLNRIEKAPVETNNLWQWIVEHYQLHVKSRKSTQKAYQTFKKHPEYFQNIHTRATPYLHHIVSELKRREMPSELALLPIIESAYRPYAHSHGRAAGLWQIIPSTGKGLGLAQNAWVDERRDIIKSTDAALTYLQQLNKRYQGDWLLTLAAYNAGMGTVNRAIRENKRKGNPTDYWSLNLPKETKQYVPKLLAAAQYLATPKWFNKLPALPNKPYFEQVTISQQADLAIIAKAANLPIEQLYQLNPSIKRWSTAPHTTHQLLLPVGSGANIQSLLSNKSSLISYKHHTIKSGDTLSAIAKKHRMSLKALKQANKIKGDYLRVGKTLNIPQPSEKNSYYTYSEQQRPITKLRLAKKYKHTIKPGESLWRIARKYDVTIKKLAAWNQLQRSDILKPGRKLTVWVGKGGSSSMNYTVRKGDSLDRISRKFSVSVRSLRKWNNISRSQYIYPGQKLRVLVKI